MFMKWHDYAMYRDDKTMTSLGNDMTMKWYDYEHVNDRYVYIYIYIYICCDMIWNTGYVINYHVYDMIYCDAICYGMICIW